MALIKEKIKQQNKEEYAYNKMLSYGWTPEQAAGIVGNLKHESGFNTGAEGDIGYKGGSSFGVAQWRTNRLQTLKQKYGSNWKDFDNQLDFVNWELNNTHKKVGDKLRDTQGIYNTGALISDRYEIPAKKFHENKSRQKDVFNIYQKYSGKPLTEQDTADMLQGTTQRARDNYQESLKPTESILATNTPQIINLAQPIELPNLAQENENLQVQQAKQELDYKQQQQNNQQKFIQDLLTASQVQYVDPNQVQDYTQYDTNNVFQAGGRYYNLPMNNPTVVSNISPLQFSLDYLNSPKYKERLVKSEYENTPKEIQTRYNNLKDVNINYERPSKLKSFITQYKPLLGSHYDIEKKTVNLDMDTDLKYLPGMYSNFTMPSRNEVEAHELSHAQIALEGSKNKETRLNDNDNSQLSSRLKPRKGLNTEDHDRKTYENKADLDAYRYILKRDGIYDAGKEDFDKNHLKIPTKSFTKDRLLRNYTEEDLIWLMNNIAQNDNQEPVYYGQSGGVIEDDMGQWKYPGEVTKINSPNISMQDVPYNVLGVADTGQKIMMQPNKNYFFEGAKSVTEYPQIKKNKNKRFK